MPSCRLSVRGPLSASVTELIRSRFGDVTTSSGPGGTELAVPHADAAAQRALLILLWDTGHDVLAMSTGERELG